MAQAAGEQSRSPADALKLYLATIPEYSTARVQFYYSSLPSRKHSNPTGYAAALAWWRKTLVDLTARGLLGDDKLVLHVDEHLREHLRWDKIGRPSSLGVITVRVLDLPFPWLQPESDPFASYCTGRVGTIRRPRPRKRVPLLARPAILLGPLPPRAPILVDSFDRPRCFFFFVIFNRVWRRSERVDQAARRLRRARPRRGQFDSVDRCCSHTLRSAQY